MSMNLKPDQRWVQGYMQRFNVISKVYTRQHRSSPLKENKIECSVALRPGTLFGVFATKKMDKNDIKTADKMHFTINVDNKRTLGFSGGQGSKVRKCCECW